MNSVVQDQRPTDSRGAVTPDWVKRRDVIEEAMAELSMSITLGHRTLTG